MEPKGGPSIFDTPRQPREEEGAEALGVSSEEATVRNEDAMDAVAWEAGLAPMDPGISKAELAASLYFAAGDDPMELYGADDEQQPAIASSVLTAFKPGTQEWVQLQQSIRML